MSLSSHLREFRVRLSWSAGFVIAGTVVGWFLFDPVFKVLQGPLLDVTRERGVEAIVNFGTVVSAFDLRIQISIFLGVLMTAPVWLWNLWSFCVSWASNSRTPLCGGVRIFRTAAFPAWNVFGVDIATRLCRGTDWLYTRGQLKRY